MGGGGGGVNEQSLSAANHWVFGESRVRHSQQWSTDVHINIPFYAVTCDRSVAAGFEHVQCSFSDSY